MQSPSRTSGGGEGGRQILGCGCGWWRMRFAVHYHYLWARVYVAFIFLNHCLLLILLGFNPLIALPRLSSWTTTSSSFPIKMLAMFCYIIIIIREGLQLRKFAANNLRFKTTQTVITGRSYHAEKGQISVIILSAIQVPRTSTDQKQVQ